VIFGRVPALSATNAILAHSVRAGGLTIRKGKRLTADQVAAIVAAGVDTVVVAQLEPDDVHEDTAAQALAATLTGAGIRSEPPFTGRSNLYAEAAGIVVIDRAAVDRLNRVDPAITLATLSEFATVTPGQMVATVKIIPFAVARTRVDAALAAVANVEVIRIAPFVRRKVGLVGTVLPSLKPAVMDKTRKHLEDRLATAGASVFAEVRVPHETEAAATAVASLRARGAELIVIFGAAATSDAGDVIPAAIEKAGGHVLRVGMPVDPGNLLVLGEIAGLPVVGAPGCARSPKENGFDWVLQRLLADVAVDSDDIAKLGVGGLLGEIPSRPQSRSGEHEPTAPAKVRIAAVILAAGRSQRMRGANKLIATIGSRPLVRIVAEAALASRAYRTIVVTGHRAEEVRSALSGLEVGFAHNPDYADGLSTSLRTGIDRLGDDVDGAIVLLGDMPAIDTAAIDRVIAAFNPQAGALIVVPTHAGKRGNPVLWSARFFDALRVVEGDVGGRHLLGINAEAVVEVEMDQAVTVDLDTPEALHEAGGTLAALSD
jgi:molybdenum cofactor cytidylyltransferase